MSLKSKTWQIFKKHGSELWLESYLGNTEVWHKSVESKTGTDKCLLQFCRIKKKSCCWNRPYKLLLQQPHSSESFSAFFSPFFLLVARAAAVTEVFFAFLFGCCSCFFHLLWNLYSYQAGTAFSAPWVSEEAKISLLNAQLGGLQRLD